MRSDQEYLKTRTAASYHIAPEQIHLVTAPYRICPLGAHIDHQLGRVTAMTLDRGVMLAYAASASNRVHLSSIDFPGSVEFQLDQIGKKVHNDWGNYLRGAVLALKKNYTLNRGLYGITAGKLSAGGLSSSAAIGLAYLIALEAVNDLHLSPTDNIVLDQAIENDYLGLNNGILDQAAILLSRQDHLTVIDCASVQHQLLAPAQTMRFKLIIAFSGIQQALINTAYNNRVKECSQAAEILLKAAGKPIGDKRLGQLSTAEYETYNHLLTGPMARRATHFFDEMQRVEQGIEAWKQGDLNLFGQLVTASGHSSIHNYECGSPPLIDLYNILLKTEGIYGARFSGAGFRGCCFALVDPHAAHAAREKIIAEYASCQPTLAPNATVLICGTGDGVRLI